MLNALFTWLFFEILTISKQAGNTTGWHHQRARMRKGLGKPANPVKIKTNWRFFYGLKRELKITRTHLIEIDIYITTTIVNLTKATMLMMLVTKTL